MSRSFVDSVVLVLATLGSVLILTGAANAQNPCEVADNGTGTVTLPPAGCEYLSPDEVHLIIDGLPAGTTIELAPIHRDFICFEQGTGGSCSISLPPNECEAPGGNLGGHGDCFASTVEFQATGTGSLAGFNRTLFIPVDVEVHTGPRNPGDPVQTFPNEMVQLEGAIFGDPDFDLLRVTGGSANGLPGPGQTTLTDLGNGNFNVDSFFDITYRIEFVGAPGSVLDGLSGVTQEQLTMSAGEPVVPPNPCVVPDNGNGTVTLPPAGCQYLSPTEVHEIIDGLPPGTTIELGTIHKSFICDRQRDFCSALLQPGDCEGSGGDLGGNVDCFDSIAEIHMQGTGDLGSFQRTISIPLQVEVHTAPRLPGAPVQEFDTEMVQLQGELFGDPDFDVLRIRGGSAHGLPSPGHTTLTRLGDGNFNVDSFFDITYEIEFVGAPGGALEGHAGTTTANVVMSSGEPTPHPCTVPDNGTGTVTLPPAGCEYLSPGEVHLIIDGLPPGTELELDPIHTKFFCGNDRPQCSVQLQPGVCETGDPTGGSGNVDCFDSEAQFEVTGTGQLAGFQRNIVVPLFVEVHTDPRTPGDPVQDFDTEMVRLRGELFGDPDFCTFRVRGGTDFGLPSPGHTTLTRLPSGDFQVDSFFDITYQIEFQGCPGSVLEGLGGTTQASVPMLTPEPGRFGSLIAGVAVLFALGRLRRRR